MSELWLRFAKVLDIVIIISGYIIAVDNILREDGSPAMAFIWGQVALFWYFQIFRKKKPEEKKDEAKTESKPAEEAASQDKPADEELPSQGKQEEK